MLVTIHDRVAALKKEGKTLEEIIAAKANGRLRQQMGDSFHYWRCLYKIGLRGSLVTRLAVSPSTSLAKSNRLRIRQPSGAYARCASADPIELLARAKNHLPPALSPSNITIRPPRRSPFKSNVCSQAPPTATASSTSSGQSPNGERDSLELTLLSARNGPRFQKLAFAGSRIYTHRHGQP